MLISRQLILLWQLACLLLGMGYALAHAAAPYAIVVNPALQVPSISKSALRAIFSMRLRTWQDGMPITVFVLGDDNPLHVDFSKESLNIFPHQLRQSWDRLVFSGTGQAPLEVNSEQEMRARIASTPGAIGYLEENMINDRVHLLPIE